MIGLKTEIKRLEDQLHIKRSALHVTSRSLQQQFLQELTKPKSFVLAFLSGFGLVYFSRYKPQAKPEKVPLLPALTHTSNLLLLAERLKKLFLV